jgi:hypothetical protein
VGKLANATATYFKKRTYFRIILVLLILFLWGYLQISELFPIQEHDLNFHAIQEIKHRYTGNTFSFAVLGDSKNSPVFDQVVSRLNQDGDLDFAIIGGDLVLYPTLETYRSFLRQWKKIQIPTLVIPGNHDLAFQDRYLYYSIFGRFYYSFVLGEAKFIFLDNSNEYNLGDEQLAWLNKELKEGLKYKYRFVFMHVPLWDPRDILSSGIRYAHSLKDTDFARRLEDLFLKYKVTILFCSHIHSFYDFTKRGLRTIITGGAGAELVGKDPTHTFYHYLRVKVSNQGVQSELVKIDIKTPFAGIKKYFHIAGLYVSTLGKIYLKHIILGFFILVLGIDAFLEYLFRRKATKIKDFDETVYDKKCK